MSTEVTTEMMNEVIARFMGGKRVQHPEQIFFSEDHFGYVCHKGHWWNENNLQYHTSWDWLMPVWKKAAVILFDIRGDLNDEKYLEAHRITKAFMEACQKAEISKAHEAVYKAVQFITWYNDNQQKQTNE